MITQIIITILILIVITYSCVQVIKRDRRMGYVVLVALYVLFITISQIAATRLIEVGPFVIPSAILIFPFIVQIIDMINEVYGKKKAMYSVLIALISQILMVAFFMLMNSLQPAGFFLHEHAWQNLFGLSIRITIASWVAFLVMQTIDVYFFAYLKKRYENKLVLRSLLSDVNAMFIDSIVFVPLAFWGVFPILPVVIGQIVLKCFLSAIDTPLFVWYRKLLD